MTTVDFLVAELQHAVRHLARIRTIQAKMLHDLEQSGLDEVKIYEHLATSKAYRQLQRDESFYQQMWLRISRHLQRYEVQAGSQSTHARPAEPQPIRQPPAPTRNQPCPCGSTLKYKRCCGNPLRQPLAA